MTEPVKRPRHLMDPNNPVRMSSYNDRSLTRVQQWVMSALTVTTLLHLVVGLIIAAAVVDATRPGARGGLLVIAGIFGLLSIAAARAIHKKKLLSPWPLVGILPAVVGVWFVF